MVTERQGGLVEINVVLAIHAKEKLAKLCSNRMLEPTLLF